MRQSDLLIGLSCSSPVCVLRDQSAAQTDHRSSLRPPASAKGSRPAAGAQLFASRQARTGRRPRSTPGRFGRVLVPNAPPDRRCRAQRRETSSPRCGVASASGAPASAKRRLRSDTRFRSLGGSKLKREAAMLRTLGEKPCRSRGRSRDACDRAAKQLRVRPDPRSREASRSAPEPPRCCRAPRFQSTNSSARTPRAR